MKRIPDGWFRHRERRRRLESRWLESRGREIRLRERGSKGYRPGNLEFCRWAVQATAERVVRVTRGMSGCLRCLATVAWAWEPRGLLGSCSGGNCRCQVRLGMFSGCFPWRAARVSDRGDGGDFGVRSGGPCWDFVWLSVAVVWEAAVCSAALAWGRFASVR